MGWQLNWRSKQPIMVMGHQIAWDSVSNNDARYDRALPIGTVAVVVAYVAVEVESLVRR